MNSCFRLLASARCSVDLSSAESRAGVVSGVGGQGEETCVPRRMAAASVFRSATPNHPLAARVARRVRAVALCQVLALLTRLFGQGLLLAHRVTGSSPAPVPTGRVEDWRRFRSKFVFPVASPFRLRGVTAS